MINAISDSEINDYLTPRIAKLRDLNCVQLNELIESQIITKLLLKLEYCEISSIDTFGIITAFWTSKCDGPCEIRLIFPSETSDIEIISWFEDDPKFEASELSIEEAIKIISKELIKYD